MRFLLVGFTSANSARFLENVVFFLKTLSFCITDSYNICESVSHCSIDKHFIVRIVGIKDTEISNHPIALVNFVKQPSRF